MNIVTTAPISRAKSATYIVSTRPCRKAGHVGFRYSNGNCVQCLLDSEAAKYRANSTFADDKRMKENARYAADGSARRERSRKFHHANRDSVLKKSKTNYAANAPARRHQMQIYREMFPARVTESRAKYAATHINRRGERLRQAMPAWANLDAMRAIYLESIRLTAETGIQMSVDHTIPLIAKNAAGEHIACGLHCEANLQIMPLIDNIRKGSRIPCL